MSYTGQPMLWVLLADGERARIVTPEAHHGRYHTVKDLGDAEHPHHLDKPHFAAKVAALLNAEAEAGSYQKLVLAAPAGVLHVVRDALSKRAAALVAGTLSKDLTKLSDHELTSHLAEWWMGAATA